MCRCIKLLLNTNMYSPKTQDPLLVFTFLWRLLFQFGSLETKAMRKCFNFVTHRHTDRVDLSEFLMAIATCDYILS